LISVEKKFLIENDFMIYYFCFTTLSNIILGSLTSETNTEKEEKKSSILILFSLYKYI